MDYEIIARAIRNNHVGLITTDAETIRAYVEPMLKPLAGIADPQGFVAAAKEAVEFLAGFPQIHRDDSISGWTTSVAEKVYDKLRKAWKGESVESAIAEIVKDVPDEELEKLPEDGAAELDHHLYGTPKKGE